MARPTLNPGKWQDRIDGTKFREYMFQDGFRDALNDEWQNKSNAEQTMEMNKRYDNWKARANAPASEPTPEDLDQQLRDAERAALDAQMRVLDIKDQIAQQDVPITKE